MKLIIQKMVSKVFDMNRGSERGRLFLTVNNTSTTIFTATTTNFFLSAL